VCISIESIHLIITLEMAMFIVLDILSAVISIIRFSNV